MKNVMLTAAFCATLAACGGSDEPKKTQAPEATPTTEVEGDQGFNVATTVDAETAKALPTMIVAKVPLDAQGNELVEQGEARTMNGPAAVSDGATADSVFATGVQTTIVDELDQDTSTSQWGGRGFAYWNTPWYLGKALGRGLWWGRNPYVYYGGYSYGYNYATSYSYNNCNYYTYYPSYGGGYGNGYGGSYGNGYGGSYGNGY